MYKISLFSKFLLSLFIISIPGCSSSNIIYDYDHTLIFSEYETYDFMINPEFNLNDSLTIDTMLYNKIKFAVNNILREKGFALEENNNPNFIVFIRSNLFPKGNSYKFHPWWQPCGYTSVSTFEDNSLVIDIIDKSNALIWRGLAPGFFKSYKKTKYLQKELDNVVSSILDGFPLN